MPSALSVRRIGRAALDLLYPPRCALCGRGGSFLCAACHDALPRAEGRRCRRCWLPLRPGGDCARCAEHPLVFDSLRSAFRYEGDARRLVHAFKFDGQSVLAAPLGAAVVDALAPAALGYDAVVPVPLSGLRGRLRGFNQALLLAREVGRALDMPVEQPLQRRGPSRPQARSRSAEERRHNVRGAFRLRRGASVAGRRILLIDDVATTGATLDECARVLLDCGAAGVFAATLARED